MKAQETLDCLIELISYYKGKVKDGSLSGSEGQIYVRCLLLAGLRDATIRSRSIEQLSEESIEILDLPFPVRE